MVTINLTWSQNPAYRYRTLAYWAGKAADGVHDRFIFRMAFGPFPGTWNWSSTCSSSLPSQPCNTDAGLVTSGLVTVNVGPPSGNPLYDKGMIVQSSIVEGGTGIVTQLPPNHYDGSYFFWHGDTAWMATTQACSNEWKTYIDNRKSNGFTVVHLALIPPWAGQEASSPYWGPLNAAGTPAPPFEELAGACPYTHAPDDRNPLYDRENTRPNCMSRWVPAFWDRFDSMIEYANEQGIMVYITGVSAPYEAYPASPAIEDFARNLAARTRGNFVILSPGFDNNPSACEDGYSCGPDNPGRTVEAVEDIAGGAIRSLSATYPMIADHHGTITTNQMAPVHDSTWLNLHGFQSGHNGGDLVAMTSRAKTIPQTVRYSTQGAYANPKKPLVNVEPVYDWGYPTSTTASGVPQDWNFFRARQAGYTSWLSGATGFSFGSVGLWEWGVCGRTPIPAWATSAQDCPGPHNLVAQDHYKTWWQTICTSATSNPERYLGDAIRQLDYWTLVANEQTGQSSRIKNNATQDSYHQMVLARDSDHLVVYLPHNDKARINLSGVGFETSFSAYLFNPRTGFAGQDSLIQTFVSGNTWDFRWAGAPGTVGSDDFVLVVQPNSGLAAGSSAEGAGGTALSTWVGSNDEGTRALWAQAIDSDGKEILSPIVVEEADSELPRWAHASQAPSGDFLVTWENRNTYGGLATVMARWLNANGEALGDSFSVASTGSMDQLWPSSAVGEGEQAWVSWVQRDPATGSSQLVIDDVSQAGNSLAAPALVDGGSSGEPRHPRIACGTSGRCFVAWEIFNRMTNSASVRYREVSTARSSGRHSTNEARQVTGNIWLHSLWVDDINVLHLVWEEFDGRGKSKGNSSGRF
ncbi:MAG: DUF4038 domain-containing protein [Thermoanaerobaculia bacterium]